MLRGIVFDMDGVIIDSHPLHRRAWKTFLQTVGRDITDAELDFILDGRKREEILCYFLGELSPSQIIDYGTRKDEMLRQLAEEMQPLQGIAEFLDSLLQSRFTNCPCYIGGTSACARYAQRIGIVPLF